jgi:hypothetical protein
MPASIVTTTWPPAAVAPPMLTPPTGGRLPPPPLGWLLLLEQPAKASENTTLERNDSSNALKEVELVTLIVNLSNLVPTAEIAELVVPCSPFLSASNVTVWCRLC